MAWRRSPRTNTNLHHFVGFWLAIPLFVLALTGAYISFPQTSRALTSMLMETRAAAQRPESGPGGPGQPLRETHISADTALSAAHAALPGNAQIVSIALPTRSHDNERPPSWRVQAQLPGADALSTVNVDDASGEASKRQSGTPSSGENFARLMRRVHSGDRMSIIWRVIMTVAGLAPAVLGVTGVVIWLRKRGARKAVSGEPQAAAA